MRAGDDSEPPWIHRLTAPKRLLLPALIMLLAILATCAAVASAAAAAPAGLYGLSTNNTLVRISAADGNMTACGPPLAAELVPGEGLGALDEAAATLFAVVYNLTAGAPFLVGIALFERYHYF